MSTSNDAGATVKHRDTGVAPADQSPASAVLPPQEDMVAMTHGQKWAEFYEALDQLVHDQFDRSNELLREAMVLPTVADQEVASIRRQAVERVAAERRRHGELLQPIAFAITETAAELTEMHQHMNTLAARLEQMAVSVTAAIETINRETPLLPAPASSATVTPEPSVAGAPLEDERAVEAPQALTAAAADESGAVSQRLIVHGVRQARLVLSLQRHLYGLDHVEGVETREYQDGTVQLQVRAARPLTLDDLQSWSDGAALEVERMTPEQIEARLPESAGSASRARSTRWWGNREPASQSANGVH